MKRIVIASLCMLLAVIFWRAPLAAQTHSPAPRAVGELKGLVLDTQDARIAVAKITVENKSYLFETQTNDEGAFQVKLPVGEYQLKIESNGFKAYIRKRVRIEAYKTETLNATLWPAPPVDVIKVK
jgi:hypothetical protein